MICNVVKILCNQSVKQTILTLCYNVLHIVLPVEGDDSSMEGFTCQSSICDFHSWFGSPSVTMYVDNCACTRKQCYGMMSNVGVHQSSCVALLEVQQPPTALKLHSVCTGYPLVVVLFCRSQRIQSKRSRGKGTACTFSQVNELLAGSLSLVCFSSLSALAELCLCTLCHRRRRVCIVNVYMVVFTRYHCPVNTHANDTPK